MIPNILKRKNAERSPSPDVPSEVMGCDAEMADDTTCSVCYAEFLDPNDLELHIQQVHPSGNHLNCQFCEKILSDAETYMMHIRDVHLLDFKSCSVCWRVFTDASQLKRHEALHPRSMLQGMFACSQCGLYFLYKSELRQHELDNHYETGEGAFLNKYFPLLSSVINIKADVFLEAIGNLDKNNNFYTCIACKYRNANLEAYVRHLTSKNCRSLACDRCSKVYKRKSGLIHHLSKWDCTAVKKISEKKIKQQCPTCKKYFEFKNIKDHSCTPNLKCSLCSSVFNSMYELSEHRSEAHPLGISLTVCQFCRKECVGTVALEKHIHRSHEPDFHLYKYSCTYCDTPFMHPQRLFAHYHLKHKDLEPYLCKICDKKFKFRKSFTLHIKLQHKSEGFVEFDERLHVFFTDKKSEKPFQPVSKFVKEKPKQSNAVPTEMDKSQELQLANMESDVYQTDIEGNQADTKKAVRSTTKRKKKEEIMELSDYDSDNEPLVVTKKKAVLKSKLKKKPLQWKKKYRKSSKKQLTCNICKKYCYTFQNYQNHVSMHFKDEKKKCIKCSLAFKTKADLDRHITAEHSKSRLTDTLKNILERRKKGEPRIEVSAKTKFLNTIKKVEFEKDNITATIRPIGKELSVQKFIEEFTPESEGKNVRVNNSISITKVTEPVPREPVIKLTKFKPAPVINKWDTKLAMPVKFKKCNELHSVTVKKVRTQPAPSNIKVYTHNSYSDAQFQDDDNDFNYDENDNRDTNVPEVEHEVTLEGTEEPPKRTPATHKIVIPKLPKGIKSIRIAHLQPEAPYYKIVKVADIIKENKEKLEALQTEADLKPPAEVRLPDGTKLVTVNPLAHLLGDTPVEQIVKPTKYYKPTRNFKEVLAKALKKLDNHGRPKKKVKKEKVVENSDKVEKNDSNRETEIRNDATEETEVRNYNNEDTEVRNDNNEDPELRNAADNGGSNENEPAGLETTSDTVQI